MKSDFQKHYEDTVNPKLGVDGWALIILTFVIGLFVLVLIMYQTDPRPREGSQDCAEARDVWLAQPIFGANQDEIAKLSIKNELANVCRPNSQVKWLTSGVLQ